MEIKNHEIIQEINRGPITTVYKARHLDLDRLVLLKVLNTQWLNEKDLLKRFKREAQISARLEHPNIVKVYDFAVSPRLVCISLEYIEGYSLDTYIKHHHPIATDIICQFIREILSAIQFAHSNNIIHRDIKPSNILIDRNNKAYLTDFGLAAIPENDKITQQGQITGTPAYLAPERVKGQPAGKASDLYSLGLTFYEMLTAKSPFQKENTAATLQSILTDNPPDVNDDRLPGWLISLVQILLSRNSAERENYVNVLPENFRQPEKNNISVRAKSPTGTATWLYSVILLSIVILSVYWISSIGSEETNKPLTREMDSVGLTERKEEALPGGEISAPGSDTVATQTIKPIERFVKPDFISAHPDSQISENTLANGGFFIMCAPWASVFINGDSLDTTPMQVPLMLKPGQYQLVLKNPNYQDILKMVEVKENIIDTLNFKLKETYGYLFIQATPWAKIYINKEYKEETPLLNPIVVHAGENIIELVNPQYQTIYDTLFIAAGKRIQKQYFFVD